MSYVLCSVCKVILVTLKLALRALRGGLQRAGHPGGVHDARADPFLRLGALHGLCAGCLLAFCTSVWGAWTKSGPPKNRRGLTFALRSRSRCSSPCRGAVVPALEHPDLRGLPGGGAEQRRGRFRGDRGGGARKAHRLAEGCAGGHGGVRELGSFQCLLLGPKCL